MSIVVTKPLGVLLSFFTFFLKKITYVCMYVWNIFPIRLRINSKKKAQETQINNSSHTKEKKKGSSDITYSFLYPFFLPIFVFCYSKINTLLVSWLLLIFGVIKPFIKHTHIHTYINLKVVKEIWQTTTKCSKIM